VPVQATLGELSGKPDSLRGCLQIHCGRKLEREVVTDATTVDNCNPIEQTMKYSSSAW
jgi:hypothetical protein